MQVSVKWNEEMTFLGQTNLGHMTKMDGQGGASAPSPMEMVLMGAGGCSSVDVVSTLKQENQNIINCDAFLSAERKEQAPRLFTSINIHFVVQGKALNEACVARAIKDSLEKYCSVCLMLGKGVKMTHSYEIKELI